MKDQVLFLTLVHPDFLPSVYAMAQVLVRRNLEVDIFSFSSPVGGLQYDGVRIHDCGHMDGHALSRALARRRFRAAASEWFHQNEPILVIATCPFSYLLAQSLAGEAIPIVYYVLETYPADATTLVKSPATAVRNWRAMRSLKRATLLCTPSPERSGWLFGRGELSSLPATILNSPSKAGYDGIDLRPPDDLLPERFRDRRIILHTGAVGHTQAVLEIISSLEHVPADAALVLTNVGDTPYARDVRKAAQASTRREDILLLPTIPRRRMLALQRAASVGLCILRETDSAPSAKLPAPNKVGEYLHAGLTIVGVRMPYLDMLEQRGLAVLAPSLDPRAIGMAITMALDRARDPSHRAHVLAAAQSWYSMEYQMRPILELIEARRQ